MNKRDPRAAVGWVGLIVLVPFLGALLYYLLGINRVERIARQKLGERKRFATTEETSTNLKPLVQVFQIFGQTTYRLSRLKDLVFEKSL